MLQAAMDHPHGYGTVIYYIYRHIPIMWMIIHSGFHYVQGIFFSWVSSTWWTQFLTHSKATCLCLFVAIWKINVDPEHHSFLVEIGHESSNPWQSLCECMCMYVCMCAHIIIRQTSDHVRLVQQCIASHHPKLCNWPLGAIGQREGRLFQLKRSKHILA